MPNMKNRCAGRGFAGLTGILSDAFGGGKEPYSSYRVHGDPADRAVEQADGRVDRRLARLSEGSGQVGDLCGGGGEAAEDRGVASQEESPLAGLFF